MLFHANNDSYISWRCIVQAASVTGVDPNPAMLKYAATAAQTAKLKSDQVHFQAGVVEDLPCKSGSFDCVVCTLTLCSVDEPENALKGITRVLRPGGKLLFIEHVQAFEPGRLRTAQRLLDPLQQLLADGCHLTRRTGDIIADAGFANVDLRRLQVPGASLISPHVWGVATK